jgi:hypothetical protein
MWKKIDNYFRDMVSFGWSIEMLNLNIFEPNSDGSHYIRFALDCWDWNNPNQIPILDTKRYEIHINHIKLNSGKIVYVINHSDYYSTQDDVIDELKRIGIK